MEESSNLQRKLDPRLQPWVTARRRLGVSQDWVAAALGVSQQSIGRAETGAHRPSQGWIGRYSTAIRAAGRLRVYLGELPGLEYVKAVERAGAAEGRQS